MKLVLPLPPPGNHYKKPRVLPGGRLHWYLTRRAEDFFDDVKRLGAGCKPLEGPVTLTLRIFRKHKRGDWDGFAKCTCDALQGILYGNDSQIVEAHVYRGDDKACPRVEVDVQPAGKGNRPLEALPLFDASDYERPVRTNFAALATPNYKPPSRK